MDAGKVFVVVMTVLAVAILVLLELKSRRARALQAVREAADEEIRRNSL